MSEVQSNSGPDVVGTVVMTMLGSVFVLLGLAVLATPLGRGPVTVVPATSQPHDGGCTISAAGTYDHFERCPGPDEAMTLEAKLDGATLVAARWEGSRGWVRSDDGLADPVQRPIIGIGGALLGLFVVLAAVVPTQDARAAA